MMVGQLTTASPGFNAQVHALAGSFRAGNGQGPAGGGASFGAIHTAQAYIYNQMFRQASVLAYIDIIRDLTVFCACMLPLLFLIPRPPKNAAASAGH
jgi:DHA2 family multidrug resistance protein